MSVGSIWDLSSDAELITAVRSGESAAFGVLYERHATAARAVARQYTNSAADADDAVQDAFSRVFAAIQGGGGPDVAFRAYLFTVLRRVALDRVEATRRAEPTDDLATFEAVSVAEASSEEPTLAGFERGVVSQAYSSLPERWQAVLWYTEVEGLSAAEIAPILGLTANGVAALAYRAREGLRQAYLQQHLAAPQSEACTLVNSKLGAYVRGGLAKRETALVDSHLEECHTCRALVLELGDVNHGMRAVIGPLVLGGIAIGLLHGIGFGGAAAAAKVGGAAGAAGGAGAAGTGQGAGGAGTGAGGAGGAGVAGGAGAGAAAGTTAAGLAAAGVAAGAVVGAAGGGATAAGATAPGVAAAAAAGGAGAAGAGGAGAGAGTAAGAAATAAGAAAGTGAAGGGIAGLLAAIAGAPALLSVVAGLVVVGAALGVAGLTGVFDSGSAVVAEPTDPGATDPGTTDPGATDPVPTDPGTTDPVTTDPGTTDLGTTDPGTTDPGTTDPGTTDPGTTDPGDDDPVVTTARPALSIGPLGDLALVAGVPSPVDVVVRNPSRDPARGVRTELTFPAGTTWTVTAAPGTVAAGLGTALPAAGTAWTCRPADATTAVCTLPGLPARTSATLHAHVLITDDVLDGERPVGIGVATFVDGGARTSTQVTATLRSAPAQFVLGEVPALSVVGDADADASASVGVPVRNTGATTARDVRVRVGFPADLPDGVLLTPSPTPGSSWTCAEEDDSLVCTVAAVRPRSTVLLGLTATIPALGGPTPVLDVDLTTGLRVSVGSATGSVELSLRSAPGTAELELDPVTGLESDLADVVTATVANSGGTTVRDLVAEVSLPVGVKVAELDVDGWTCTATATGATCALTDLAPGDRVPLELPVLAAQDAAGEITVALAGSAARSAVEVLLPEVELSTGLAADLVSGAGGTVSFELSNTGPGTAADVVALVELPRAVRLADDLADLGAWACERTDAQHAVCTLPRLAPGADAGLALPVTADGATSSEVTLEVRTGNRTAALVSDRAAVRLSSGGLAPRGRWTDGWAATEIGAPVLSCDPATERCAAALADLAGSAQNNGFPMVTVADSAASLSVPDGREIAFAGLYWSANRHATETWTGSVTEVAVRAPGGSWTSVTGTQIAATTDNANRVYYQSFADVTDLVRGSGTVAVRGVATAATRVDPNPSYYGGWSLVVVYAEPDARGDVAVYDGGAWVASNSSSAFVFATEADRTARIGVVAWDGDRASSGNDRLTLDGTALVPVRRDGSLGVTTDAFTSTAMGSAHLNTLGVDAKPFATVELAAGLHRLVASTGGDQYLIGAVTLTSTPD